MPPRRTGVRELLRVEREYWHTEEADVPELQTYGMNGRTGGTDARGGPTYGGTTNES
ncbi:hypothetical protein SAMN04489717_4754 [Actinopolymorpha singaporensis]|uniref:Uncharacterized protein n=1 Tax=Actinopolymorpha singaporensis TaxID=117157 RepID=A0A1H1X0B9_9ACTN|nr:hypothetical protein SAMN04489717_4754 [Actinopolymorpha singaporensis]